jgi:hypothetical protein
VTLIRSFDTLDEAEAARSALVDAGVPTDAIEVTITEHETGPAQGNWIAGDGRKEVGGEPGQGEEGLYEANYQDVAQRSVCLLVVQGATDATHASVLDQFVCRDPEAAAKAANPE